MDPLVTIITPTLNRARYIDAVVACVRAQTYGNIEHIVVDGGSTDDTIDRLRYYENEFGLRWISESDTGMYNAVNKGLEMVQGEIVAYLNTDDRYFPYSVQVAVDALRDPTVWFVYGDMVNFDEAAGDGMLIFYPPATTNYLVRGGFIGQPTVFWKRAVTEEVGGFDESLALAADHEYWRRIGSRFRGARVNEVMAYEEEHEQRLTAGAMGRKRGLAELETVRDRYLGRPVTAFEAFAEKGRLALWHRFLTARFLWNRARRRNKPGRGWGGFIGHQRSFDVDVGKMLLGMVPVAGRNFKRSVVRS